ncbi:MAG: NUDIX hydrolase [Cyclobacteriaceae bacterium]|nr:NUDIX hydrolase [Cyclobacteriaceae bacterium]
MSRQQLISQLQEYTSPHSEEMEFRLQFLDLITTFEECFERSLLSGHITGSAWILDESREYALLTHHMKLDKWLQLGGHADGDTQIERVAQREALEESGLKSIALSNHTIFDLDIHTIPERKDEPEHFHFDIRFLFQATKSEPLHINHESKALKWVKLSAISALVDNDISIMRMVNKSIQLPNGQ